MAFSDSLRNRLYSALRDDSAAREIETYLLGAPGAALTVTEAGYLAGVTAGANAASKAVVLDSSSKIDALDITAVKINGTAVTATAAEVNGVCHGQPSTATIVAATNGANATLLTITVKDGAGSAVTGPLIIDVHLSDAASGAGLTATTASGAVQAGASGVDLQAVTVSKHLRVQTTALGVYILSITDTAKTRFYVTATIGGLKPIIYRLATADYGA